MTHDELKRITRKTLAWARTIELIDVSPYFVFYDVEKDAIKGRPNAQRIKKVFDEQYAILEMAARLKE